MLTEPELALLLAISQRPSDLRPDRMDRLVGRAESLLQQANRLLPDDWSPLPPMAGTCDEP